MKTKWSFLMIIALLAMLAGATASPAQAQTTNLSLNNARVVDPETEQPAEPSIAGHWISVHVDVAGAYSGASCMVNPGDGSVVYGTFDDSYTTCKSEEFRYLGAGFYNIEVKVANFDGSPAITMVGHMVNYTDATIDSAFVADPASGESLAPSFVYRPVRAVVKIRELYSASGCTIDYGDGSGPETGVLNPEGYVGGCFGPEHLYATPGTYRITAAVTSFTGSTDTMSLTHVVATFLLEQLPDGSNVVGSDPVGCGYGNCALAANFMVLAGESVTIDMLQLWGAYATVPGSSLRATDYTDSFTVVFHPDASGLPGTPAYSESAVSAQREPTGRIVVVNGTRYDEYRITLTLAESQTFAPGEYWVEIYNTNANPATAGSIGFGWEAGDADTLGMGLGYTAIRDNLGNWINPSLFTLSLRLIDLPPTYSISGTVFNDLDGSGTWDTGETSLYGAYVSVDLGCNGTAVVQVPVYGDGSYSLDGLPGGVCVALGGWHPADAYDHNGWKQTTPAVQFDLLSADQTGVNIGLQEYSLDYTPRGGPGSTGLPDGQLNQPYSQTITVLGGFAPYTYIMGNEGNLPTDELSVTMDAATGIITISGTPTAAGAYQLDMYVTDANGAEIEVQGSFFIKTDASFSLTSSLNPSDLGDPVTFSLSATGTVVNYLPQAPVTFKADGVVIAGCEGLILGYQPDPYSDTVACTTSALAAGSHVITADFTPGGGPYNNATITLEGGQTVQAPLTPDHFFILPEPSLAGYSMMGLHVDFVSPVDNQAGNVPTPYTCTVDYGDGTPVQDGYLSSRNGQYVYACYGNEFYTYSSPGTYTIIFTIKDLQGNKLADFTTQHAVITDPDPGYITVAPNPAPVNATVTFTTSADGYDYYRWAVVGQDSPFGMAQTSQTTFTEAGTYKVLLIAMKYDMTTQTPTVLEDVVEVTVIPASSADLSLAKTDSKDPVKPGAQLVYTLTVNNLGPDAAQTLTLVDTLDRNTKYVSVAAPRGWSCRYANYAVTCTRSSLASGSSAIIKITVTVNKTARVGRVLVNNAQVSSATYDPLLANNTVVQKTLVMR